MNERAYPVRKGETVRLRVEALAFGGQGVARIEGYTVFVEGGIPGQVVEATVSRRRRSHAEARIERVVEPSPEQVEPRCAHFGTCGGCRFQHLDYAAQLREKRRQVEDCLRRLGGLDRVPVIETLPAPAEYGYRNKMEYSFSPMRWLEPHEIARGDRHDRFGLGLHPRGRHDRVLNVERCHLQDETGARVLELVREHARTSGIPPYSTRTHTGFWRFLVVRTAHHTGERMVHLITNRTQPGTPEWRAVETLTPRLRAAVPEITSLLHGMTDAKASVAVARSVRVLHGEPVIREKLLDLEFTIGPHSFFQTNTAQAERLFTEALRRADPTPEEVVWDLYCGAGALSLPLARRARNVVGVEVVEEAVAAARANAQANGIENVRFVAGDIRNVLADDGPDLPPPDLAVLDPPRAGVHEDVLRALAARRPRRIVYVSCNPATLARDLTALVGDYAVEEVVPVDMFPHTAHVECVATLNRRSAQSGG